jgi:hypothetical protein
VEKNIGHMDKDRKRQAAEDSKKEVAGPET